MTTQLNTFLHPVNIKMQAISKVSHDLPIMSGYD